MKIEKRGRWWIGFVLFIFVIEIWIWFHYRFWVMLFTPVTAYWKKKTIQCCQNWIMNKKVLDNLLQKDSFTTVNSFVVFLIKCFTLFLSSLQTWKEILISIVTTTINLSKTQWRTNGIYPENHLSKIKKILSKNTSNIAHDLNNFSQRKNKINGISHLKFYCVSHVM